MFTSLRARLMLTYLVIIGVVLCILGITILVYVSQNPIPTLRARLTLQTTAEAIQQSPVDWNSTPIEQFQALAEQADQLTSIRVQLYSRGGSLIADSRLDMAPSLRLDGFPPAEIDRRLVNVVKVQDANGDAWLHLIRPLDDQFWLVVATPEPVINLREAIRSRWEDVIRPLRRAGFLALIVSLIFAFWMARWISSPLLGIKSAANRVANGEYQQIDVAGPDEVQDLADSFNEMSAKVESTHKSMQEFTANVSHELKTPLTSIQGFSQAILDGTVDTEEELTQTAGIIHAEAGRMHRLVLDLLELARFDAGTIELDYSAVDIRELMEIIIHQFQPMVQERQVEIINGIGPDFPLIECDRDRIFQVLINILENAVKHTPEGKQVIVDGKISGKAVQIGIQDFGAGITEADANRLFERFFQVDKSRSGGMDRGSGLGLAIASEIVQAHGGKITIRSKIEEGSIFLITIPMEPIAGENRPRIRRAGK